MQFISNVDAKKRAFAKEIRSAIVGKVSNPVHWYQSIQFLLISGAETCMDVGPSNILSNFVLSFSQSADYESNVYSNQAVDEMKSDSNSIGLF